MNRLNFLDSHQTRKIVRAMIVGITVGWVGIGHAQLATSPWPKRLGDLGNRSFGVSSGTIPVLKWNQFENIDPDNPDFNCSDLLVGQSGKLYATIYSPSSSYPHTYSVDPQTGSVLQLGNLGLNLYAMTNSHNIISRALSSVSDQTGNLNWSTHTTYDGIPNLDSNGALYLGQGYGGGGVLAVNSVDGTVIWQNTTVQSDSSVPAIGADHHVYFTCSNSLTAVDGLSGSVIWNYPPAYPNNFSLSVPLLNSSTVYFTSQYGTLFALDAATGNLKWSYDTGRTENFDRPLAVDSLGHIIAYAPTLSEYTSAPGCLMSFDPASGSVLWKTNQSVENVIATTGGMLLCLDVDGTLSSVDAATGKVNWHCDAGDGELALGGDGTLFVSGFSSPSALYAFDTFAHASLTVPATVGTGGTTIQGTITLPGVLLGKMTVKLRSQNPTYVSLPDSITIDAGKSSKSFPIVLKGYSSNYSANIAASFDGVSKSALVNVQNDRITGFSINPNPVSDGTTTNLIITLASPAPPAGWQIALKYGNTVQEYLTVPSGTTTASFPYNTDPGNTAYNDYSVQLTVSDFSTSKSATLSVLGRQLHSVTVGPNSFNGGSSAMGTVTIGAPDMYADTTITLSTNNASQVTVPASIVIPSGSTSATFPITTKPSYTTKVTTLTASDGYTTKTTTFSIIGDSIQKLVLNPASLTGGTSSTATVTLTSPAPSGGWTVNLNTGNPNFVQVPASITVPAGSTTATFTVTTVHYTRTYSTSVNALDATSKASATITVNP